MLHYGLHLYANEGGVFLMTKTEKRGVRGAGKVAFWARKESIGKMLEDKYSLIATFLAHEKELGIGYGQFRRYVDKFIKGKENDNKDRKSVRGTDTGRDSQRTGSTPIRTRTPGQPAFVSSDTPRDDLVKPKK
jgi:hypothetical protein